MLITTLNRFATLWYNTCVSATKSVYITPMKTDTSFVSGFVRTPTEHNPWHCRTILILLTGWMNGFMHTSSTGIKLETGFVWWVNTAPIFHGSRAFVLLPTWGRVTDAMAAILTWSASTKHQRLQFTLYRVLRHQTAPVLMRFDTIFPFVGKLLPF